MKLSISIFLSMMASVVAFAPSTHHDRVTTSLHATDRKAFLSAAAAATGLAVLLVSGTSAAWAMDQENVDTPTEQWETGSPTPAAEKARTDRMTNQPRTQMTSNFAPIKRLTLERKSPVVSK